MNNVSSGNNETLSTVFSLTKVIMSGFVYVAIETVGNVLLFGIVAYERQGCDPTKRTILNQLLSLICSMCLLANGTTLHGQIWILTIGHLDHWPTVVLSGLQSFYVTTVVIAFDQMVVFRLVYIFDWKKVAGINDQFTGTFIIMATTMVAFVVTMARLIYGSGILFHRQYEMMAGLEPIMPIRTERIFHGLLVLSVLIHVVGYPLILWKRWRYKQKTSLLVPTISARLDVNTTNCRQTVGRYNTTARNKTLIGTATQVTFAIMLVVILPLISLLSVAPNETIFVLRLSMTYIVSSLVAPAIFYSRHAQARQFLKRHLVQMCQNMFGPFTN